MKVTVINGSLSANEQELYAKRVSCMYPGIEIDELLLDAGGEKIQYQAVVYKRVLAKQGGAVIGDPMMWNDAKRAEYKETVPNLFDIL